MFQRRAWLAALLALGFVRVGFAGSIPVETFFKDLAFPSVVLSPSGKYYAALYSSRNTINLLVVDIAGKSAQPLTAFDKPTKVTFVGWDSDDRLVYSFDTVSGDGFYLTSLAAVNRDGKNPLMLIDNAGHDILEYEFNPQFVDWLRSDPGSVLIATDVGSPEFPVVYKVDITSAWHPMQSASTASKKYFPTKRTKVMGSPGRKCRYMTDSDGNVRVCTTTEMDGTRRLLYRGRDSSEWVQLATFQNTSRILRPIGFTADNDSLYVLTNRDRDTVALYEMSVVTGKLTRLVYEVPSVDLRDAVWSADDRTLLGVSYHTDFAHTHYFDPKTAQLQKDLFEVFPGDTLSIENFSDDGNRAVVLAGDERSPGKFYLYDGAKQEVKLLTPRAPWIDSKQMSAMKQVQYSARDGLKITAYLTVPNGRPAKNLPLIVYPHGGPFMVQDTEGWRPSVQFLASRGYAVLQMNFRGSGGEGAKFREAGNREWGGKMIEDITDAVTWATHEGVADAKRVCIFGGSYGGYAALMSAATNPDMYRCAMSYAGVTDLESMFDGRIVGDGWYADTPPELLAYFERTIGERRDSAFMHEHSPLYNAEKINCPVFIAHGRRDDIVALKNSTQMRDALLKAHKTVEYLEKPSETHGFHDEQNQIELFTRIDAFLQKYNPAGDGAVAVAGTP